MTHTIPADKLVGLSPESKSCLQRLAEYDTPPLPECAICFGQVMRLVTDVQLRSRQASSCASDTLPANWRR